MSKVNDFVKKNKILVILGVIVVVVLVAGSIYFAVAKTNSKTNGNIKEQQVSVEDIEILEDKGIITGIITSEEVELNQRRADKLRLDFLESGCKDKLAAIQKRCEKYGISLEQVVYVGDDINDLEAVRTVGYGCCPSDAMPCVQQAADYIASSKGGQGVIREIVEQLLEEP